MTQMKIAELKQLCSKPEVVEVWDVTASDPRLLVYLKVCEKTLLLNCRCFATVMIWHFYSSGVVALFFFLLAVGVRAQTTESNVFEYQAHGDEHCQGRRTEYLKDIRSAYH